ncbi:hypothetical protein LJC19_08130 [Oxalobacter sp. OttesenSCG-928-P03]|nr:hypothetical protein [Oxalobacter sp. OttesenSCG-928-P03]
MHEAGRIENAGLVLTAPFLPHFFRNLGFLDVMRFATEEAHAKALYLLQYMADGGDYVEGDLSLNALLCGWPLSRPVPAPPALSAVEKQQADQVVEAIRAHWTVLGGMAPDALRAAFFRRQGTLDIGLETSLVVAPQPQDTFLRELPWVYAVTRTPWSETIRVEW